MEYDIFESISQGEYGENATQNGRMEEVADFLFRSCANNETESCSSSEYGGNLYSEQSYVEKYAKENNCWYSIEDPDFDYASPILDFSIFRGQNRHFCPRLVSFEHQTRA